MIGGRCAKATDKNVAWLHLIRANLIKTVCLQVIQVEVFTFIPPVFFTMEIRQINPGQMVSITEKRVTVVHTMLKLPARKVRHAAEFINLVVTDQPPRKRRL